MRFESIDKMRGEDVVSEAESLARYASRCREIGQGINSKESVRFHRCIERIEEERLAHPETIVEIRVMWDERLGRSRDMLLSLYRNGGTLAGMRKLFAPAT